MKKILLSFLLSITLICSFSFNVYASGTSGGGYTRPSSITDTTGFNDWSLIDKANFLWDNLLPFSVELVGFVADVANYGGTKWNADYVKENLTYYWDEAFLSTKGFSSYDEYIGSLLSMDDDGNIIADNELSDMLYQCACQYIEEETGFFTIPTLSTNELIASSFYNKDTMDAFKKYINDSGSDIVFVNGGLTPTGSVSGFKPYKTYDGTLTVAAESAYVFLRVPHDWGIVNSGGVKYTTYNEPYIINSSLYDSDWNAFTSLTEKKFDFITINALVPYSNTCYEYELSGNTIETNYYIIKNDGMKLLSNSTFFTKDSYFNRIFTTDGRDIRIYKTLEDFKNYSVGTRPYYITDKFQDYDINGDNSCIVTESDLSNGSVYGDVYNYIINNYDNPDSLTEDELRDILNDYLGQGSGTGNGNGNNNGTGNSGSGSGLSGFLSGLGSIGDAILSILGKLLEYVGKAIELLSGTVTKVIDLIPSNITNLFGALFPFIPEEWKTGIELSIAIGVIVGIVCIFKK